MARSSDLIPHLDSYMFLSVSEFWDCFMTDGAEAAFRPWFRASDGAATKISAQLVIGS